MSLGFVQASGGEPDLMGVCENDMDRVTLRNIVYSLWAVNKGDGSGGASSCYLVCFLFSKSLFFRVLSAACILTDRQCEVKHLQSFTVAKLLSRLFICYAGVEP